MAKIMEIIEKETRGKSYHTYKFYMRLEDVHCLNSYSASKEEILRFDEYVRPMYEKTHKPSSRKRIVDFNQGMIHALLPKLI